ncbi:tetratricopeptide repeat protein [Pseudoalteromonas sp. MMG022]|uniref:tetratricopeptide repeat protein n=1 Tax=Pseudoalteromonas sp. MMG022 TaxID=2909978 RepID=UPI001F40F066|nr:tetratricopeptide repeat protein [Pseudoalteromonas sp. MMG022]MCF6436849.1 tetratricopeptide repeat protein [Pseudoalteromonas sp. MMG022]
MRAILLIFSVFSLPLFALAHDAPTPQSEQASFYQLVNIHEKLASLDERVKQQQLQGNDIKSIEEEQLNLKIKLEHLNLHIATQTNLQTQQLTGFDDRVSDLSFYLALYGVIITLLALGLGLSARNRAIYEAKQQASIASEAHMQDWIKHNKSMLIAQTKNELEKASFDLKDNAEKLEAQAKEALDKIQTKHEQKLQELVRRSEQVLKESSHKMDTTKMSVNTTQPELAATDWFEVGLEAIEAGDFNKALEAWDKVLEALEENEDLTLRAITLFNKGATLSEGEQAVEAIAVYQHFISAFKDSQITLVKEHVAKAMLNLGVEYYDMGRFEESVNTYNKLIERFSDTPDNLFQEQTAKAMLNKVNSLRQLGKLDEALTLLDSIVDKCVLNQGDIFHLAIATAYTTKGMIYGELGHYERAMSLYEYVVKRFETSQSKELIRQVDIALTNSAELALLCESSKQALKRVQHALANINDPELTSVMQFIRFLLDDCEIGVVLNAIAAIPKDAKISWQFSELKDYLKQFEGDKQQHIQAILAFFEQHQDVDKLKAELGK